MDFARKMCLAVNNELSDRWKRYHPALHGGGASELYMQTFGRMAKEFLDKALVFFGSHDGASDPLAYLELLKGLADRFKTRIEAGEFDTPTTAEQQQPTEE